VAVSIVRRIAFSLDIRNIVVLRAFQLVLLYYFTLSKVLDVKALHCQEKNIDILEVPLRIDFPILGLTTEIQSRSVLPDCSIDLAHRHTGE
jgi:hypothetical protein